MAAPRAKARRRGNRMPEVICRSPNGVQDVGAVSGLPVFFAPMRRAETDGWSCTGSRRDQWLTPNLDWSPALVNQGQGFGLEFHVCSPQLVEHQVWVVYHGVEIEEKKTEGLFCSFSSGV